MGLEDEIIINGEVYVRKTPSQGTHGQGVSSASAVVSLQEKLNRKKLEEENAQDDSPDGGIMSVQMIKQKMRLVTNDRVSNGVEIGMEPIVEDNASVASPPSPSPPAPPPMVYSNNNFMKRNVKVKEWNNFSIRDSEEEVAETVIDNSMSSSTPADDDLVTIRSKSNSGHASSFQSTAHLAAKQSEAVDTLKKKLEQKKQTTKQESSSIGGGSSIVTNGFNSTSSDVNVFQAGFGRNEIFSMNNQGQASTSTPNRNDWRENNGVTSSMVNINVTNSTPNAKITFSSFDKSKEDYMRQFSEKTRPVSESSPIKAELESIISNKVQETSDKPIVITSRTKEDDDEAQKAAVKAIEIAFMKKKASQEKEETIVKSPPVETETPPVPASRQSIRKKQTPSSSVEYKEVKKTSSGTGGPNITFVNVNNSQTDYSKLTKIGHQ